MKKKKNPSNFDLVIGDRYIAAWLAKQHRRAAVVEGALAFCLAAGVGSDAYASMFLPAEARPAWPAKNGAHGKRPAGPATNAAAPPANRVLGDFAAPPRPKTPSAAGDFK